MTTTRNTRKPMAAFSANFCIFNLTSFVGHYMHGCLVVQSERLLPLLQSIMTECQCVYVVVQDSSLVICTSHKGLGLLFRGNIESLVVDALEAAFDHCISLLLGLKNTLAQFDVLHAHSLTIDHDIARNSLCCIVYDVLLIYQADSTSSVSVPRTP